METAIGSVSHTIWRASARRGALWVNEFHAERNADVILFLDSFADARRGGTGTLDEAIRAAASLAERYLAGKDRVGLETSAVSEAKVCCRS